MLKDTMIKRATRRKVTTIEEQIVCPCGYEAKDAKHAEYFTWANLDGRMVLLCWGCTDKLHKNTLEKERE